MSKFPGRSGKALLVIDVQNEVVAQAWQRDEVIGNINAVVAKARSAGTPVIWVQHSDPWLVEGTPAWDIVDELQPASGEQRIHKHFRSSFEDTSLDVLLEQLGAGHLYICGAQTDACIRHTTHAALERGYDVTLVRDAHTTTDETGHIPAATVIEEQNRNLDGYRLPGRRCEVTPAAAVFA